MLFLERGGFEEFLKKKRERVEKWTAGEEIVREFKTLGLCLVPRKQNIWDRTGRENFVPRIASPKV